MTDVHLTRLFEWALRRIGAAAGWSLLTAFICGILAAATQQAEVLYLAGFAAPLAAVFTLVNSKAPMPYDEDDLESSPETEA